MAREPRRCDGGRGRPAALVFAGLALLVGAVVVVVVRVLTKER